MRTAPLLRARPPKCCRKRGTCHRIAAVYPSEVDAAAWVPMCPPTQRRRPRPLRRRVDGLARAARPGARRAVSICRTTAVSGRRSPRVEWAIRAIRRDVLRRTRDRARRAACHQAYTAASTASRRAIARVLHRHRSSRCGRHWRAAVSIARIPRRTADRPCRRAQSAACI